MLFLVRCIFWLSIVYASILLPKDKWAALTQSAMRTGDEAFGRAIQRATSEAVGYCRSRSRHCLDEAAGLTALIEATGPGLARGADDPISALEKGSIPLPVPRQVRSVGKRS